MATQTTTVLDRLTTQGHVETDWMIHFTWTNGYGDTKKVATGVTAMTQALAIMSARDKVVDLYDITRAQLVMVERWTPGKFECKTTYKRTA